MKKALKFIGFVIIAYIAFSIVSGIISGISINYTVIEKTETKEHRTIKIELEEKVTKEELAEIAKEQQEENDLFDILYIFYYIKGQDSKGVAWATTNFTPELEVNILGATKEDDKKPKPEITGKILNKWYDNNAMTESDIYLVEENGTKYIKILFKKSKEVMTEKLTIKKQKDGRLRYDYKNTHGEYYLLEKNGNLGIYDNDGKFREYKKK